TVSSTATQFRHPSLMCIQLCGRQHMSGYLTADRIYSGRRRSRGRRGATLILTVILMFTMFSFLAFGVDTGYLSQSRAEIRRTADAAAMAGCWELYSQLEQGQTAVAAQPNI